MECALIDGLRRVHLRRLSAHHSRSQTGSGHKCMVWCAHDGLLMKVIEWPLLLDRLGCMARLRQHACACLFHRLMLALVSQETALSFATLRLEVLVLVLDLWRLALLQHLVLLLRLVEGLLRVNRVRTAASRDRTPPGLRVLGLLRAARLVHAKYTVRSAVRWAVWRLILLDGLALVWR